METNCIYKGRRGAGLFSVVANNKSDKGLVTLTYSEEDELAIPTPPSQQRKANRSLSGSLGGALPVSVGIKW